jgi:SulP family sulfate permease
VISGFITASGMIIATSQVGGLLGIRTEGHAMPDLVMSIMGQNIGAINMVYGRRGRRRARAVAVDPA